MLYRKYRVEYVKGRGRRSSKQSTFTTEKVLAEDSRTDRPRFVLEVFSRAYGGFHTYTHVTCNISILYVVCTEKHVWNNAYFHWQLL